MPAMAPDISSGPMPSFLVGDSPNRSFFRWKYVGK
jgi:hypothetical protein